MHGSSVGQSASLITKRSSVQTRPGQRCRTYAGRLPVGSYPAASRGHDWRHGLVARLGCTCLASRSDAGSNPVESTGISGPLVTARVDAYMDVEDAILSAGRFL